jgi:diguanylate cyclase (GGDEF)-like protein
VAAPANNKILLAPPLWLGGAVLALLIAVVLLAAYTVRLDRRAHQEYEQALTLAHLSFEVQGDIARLRTLRGVPIGTAEVRELDARLEQRLEQRLRAIDARELSAAERAEFAQLAQAVAAARQHAAPRNGTSERGAAATAATDPAFDAIDRALAAFFTAVHARADAAALQAHQLTGFIEYALAGAALLMLALGATLASLLARTMRAHRTRLGQLDQLAREDGLTGVLNRRALDEMLPVELARAERLGYTLSVAMLDLDYFKRFNDKRGHGAGDALLRNAARAWRAQLRPTDLLARYGGEEFTLVLPSCDAAQAVALIDRLRPLMPERQTFSAGVAQWNGADAPDALIRTADGALLAAKRGGRNRTVVAEPDRQVALPLYLGQASSV